MQQVIYANIFFWGLVLYVFMPVLLVAQQATASVYIASTNSSQLANLVAENATHQLCIDFLLALQADRVEDLEGHIIGVSAMMQVMHWPSTRAARKKMRDLRVQQMMALYDNFERLRQQASDAGVVWAELNLVHYQLNDAKLHNLRIVFKDAQQTYWLEIETIGPPSAKVLYMGEHIKSEFDKAILPSNFERNSYVLLHEHVHSAKDLNNEPYYETLEKQYQQNSILDSLAVHKFRQLVQDSQVLIDSVLLEINEIDLLSNMASPINQLMLEEDNAHKIQLHFSDLNHFVNRHFTSTQIAEVSLNLIEVERNDWAMYIFKDLPPVACKMLLHKWQKDLKKFEHKVLQMWLRV